MVKKSLAKESHGEFKVEHPQPLIAGELTQIRFSYTLGPGQEFTELSKLRIGIPNCGWEKPYTPEPYYWPEFQKGDSRVYTLYGRVNTTVQARSSDSRAVGIVTAQALMRKSGKFPPSRIYDFRRWWITVQVEDGELQEGDSLQVFYGDPEEEPPGVFVQRFPEKRICFLAFVDFDGSGAFGELSGSPFWVEVLPGPPARLDAFQPTIRTCTEPRIRAVLTDRLKCRPSPSPSPHIEVHNQTVIETDLGFETILNPSIARANGPQIYWGEFHGQSMYHGWNPKEKMGIGSGTPEECHAYARDVACLDFVALTDSASMQGDCWETVRGAALEAHEPGRFVVFQATETGNNVEGHRNLIFRGANPEPRLPATPIPLPTSEVHRLMRGRDDVLLIPHHTKIWTHWDIYEPSLEPVMEVCSTWGVFEKRGLEYWNKRQQRGLGAQEAWRRGHRLGLVGGTDTHTGTPGRSFPFSERNEFMCYKGGLTAVWASDLSRESIFDAVKRRHCYATTGVRMFIEFCLGKAVVGQEVGWDRKDQPRVFHVTVVGTARLKEVILVKNNQDYAVFYPSGDEFRDEVTDRVPVESGDFYYLRVLQEDHNMGWASPIWIDLSDSTNGRVPEVSSSCALW